MRTVHKWSWFIVIFSSIFLLVATWQKLLPMGIIEVLGFITGAVCVMFVVQQNMWNFPVGIANNIFFIILFFSSKLYGDMALQIIYIILGVMGWWQWMYGGSNKTKLNVNKASILEIIILLFVCIVATFFLQKYLITVNDSSPFLDALTTVLSLIAQYLLNFKRIENWFVWIAADVIYVGLYIQKDLFLTATLYALFIAMCVAGLVAWKNAARKLAIESC